MRRPRPSTRVARSARRGSRGAPPRARPATDVRVRGWVAARRPPCGLVTTGYRTSGAPVTGVASRSHRDAISELLLRADARTDRRRPPERRRYTLVRAALPAPLR